MATITHESFVNSVAALAIEHVTGPERELLSSIKLVYGAGESGVRGITYYNRWTKGDASQPVPFVEICAFGQESWLQIAGTTIHELGHVLAGFGAGHGKAWKEACETLGLRRCKAAGTAYKLAMFEPTLRQAVAALPRPTEGQPVARLTGLNGAAIALRPCPAGIGTRGGKSRGTGSGSRLRLWQCDCGCKARVASDDFQATHTPCGTSFKQL